MGASVAALAGRDVQSKSLAVFAAALLLYVVLFLRRDPGTTFLTVVGCVILSVWYLKAKAIESVTIDNKADFFDSIQGAIAKMEFAEGDVYSVHKGPRRILYLRDDTADVLSGMLYDMRFVMAYDAPLFYRVVILTEQFLKIHYNVMLGRYDPALMMPVMHDIRATACNHVHGFIFTLPRTSTIVAVPGDDVDVVMASHLRTFRGETARLMKVVKHRFRRLNLNPDYTRRPIGVGTAGSSPHDLY